MKILQVNNVYADKSTGKITKVLHDGLLQAGHESMVVYGRGRTVHEPGVIRLCPNWYGKVNSLLARITGMPYGGCMLSTSRLIRMIRREKPDIVHLQCINGNFINIYRLINWLKKNQIKTVVGLHAEFMYTGNCGHAFECEQWKHGCQKCPDKKRATKSWLFDRTRISWRKMRDAFDGFDKYSVIAPVSPWTQERAQASDILKGFSFQTIYNGIDCRQLFFYQQDEKVNEATVLNVTAHFSQEKDHAKGGWYLTQLAKDMPNVTFLVAGKADSCENLPDNLCLLGEITNQKDLAELYRKAALSVVVSKRETFSMPCAESLCCGTPVVGFKAGAPEQIALPEYSEFVEFGDTAALKAAINSWLFMRKWNRGLVADLAAKEYSSETMIEAYLDMYRRMVWN